jgi:hypothetical protein
LAGSCARPNTCWGGVGWRSRTDHRRLCRCFGAAQLAGRQLLRLADCLSSVNLVVSLLVALDDLERNPNGADGAMSRRKPNACGEKGADDSQKISFGVRGRLSRFRSYPTVRHRHRFRVWALTSARHWTGHRAKRMKDNSMDKDRIKGTVEPKAR